ncbi:hypothetical protein FACS1894167_11630 [Synergistales bacterium]|nr:hypothetical protein FACS1894167_11630 [Synergistales bacterium]
MYCRKGTSVADFIDYGKKIVVSEKTNDDSILAALQLASQKWGAVQINGSEEYKSLCVRLAVQHGVKVANAELKPEIEALRKSAPEEQEKDTGWSR